MHESPRTNDWTRDRAAHSDVRPCSVGARYVRANGGPTSVTELGTPEQERCVSRRGRWPAIRATNSTPDVALRLGFCFLHVEVVIDSCNFSPDDQETRLFKTTSHCRSWYMMTSFSTSIPLVLCVESGADVRMSPLRSLFSSILWLVLFVVIVGFGSRVRQRCGCAIGRLLAFWLRWRSCRRSGLQHE